MTRKNLDASLNKTNVLWSNLWLSAGFVKWSQDYVRPHYIIVIYHKSVAIFSSLDIYHSHKLVAYSCTVDVEKHLARLSCLNPYSLQNVLYAHENNT